MNIQEQIARERAAAARLGEQLAACRAELRRAERERSRSIDSAIELAHARLGVSAAERLLKAHLDSLETLCRRAQCAQ